MLLLLCGLLTAEPQKKHRRKKVVVSMHKYVEHWLEKHEQVASIIQAGFVVRLFIHSLVQAANHVTQHAILVLMKCLVDGRSGTWVAKTDKVGANAETRTSAHGRSDGWSKQIKHCKGGSGDQGNDEDLLGHQGLAGDEIGSSGHNCTLKRVLEEANQNLRAIECKVRHIDDVICFVVYSGEQKKKLTCPQQLPSSKYGRGCVPCIYFDRSNEHITCNTVVSRDHPAAWHINHCFVDPAPAIFDSRRVEQADPSKYVMVTPSCA